MSIYHKDKCTSEEIAIFRHKVIAFLRQHSIKPHAIKAFRSYNGEIRLYKSEPSQRLRLRMGRILVAFKNPNGSYEGRDEEDIEFFWL